MVNKNENTVISGNNKMVGQLYPEIASPMKNLIFSPLSLHSILSLVYQGSAGSTEQAFRKVLHIPNKLETADGYKSVMTQLNNVPNVTLEIANRVYVKNGYKMKAKFLEVATNEFAAGAESIDFVHPSAAKAMNVWVEQKSKNKIKDLIRQDQLDGFTRMVLINAVYFKGDWCVPFDKQFTRPDKFYVSETETLPCEMMFRNGKFSYKDDAELGAQVVQLPYMNPALSMVIVLPHSKTGLGELEKKMTAIDLSTLTENMHKSEVDLYLPKFKIESTIQLNDPLSKIGLEEAFSDNANFSELLDCSESLKISKVVQKAFIEVNEEGAEAAAATGVIMSNKCRRIQIMKIVFHAEHPFLFYLLNTSQDDVKQMLFYGKLITLLEK